MLDSFHLKMAQKPLSRLQNVHGHLDAGNANRSSGNNYLPKDQGLEWPNAAGV